MLCFTVTKGVHEQVYMHVPATLKSAGTGSNLETPKGSSMGVSRIPGSGGWFLIFFILCLCSLSCCILKSRENCVKEWTM